MKQGEGFKRVLSLICALGLIFSVLGNEPFAYSAKAMTGEEYVDTQNDEIDNELSLSDHEDNTTGEIVVSEVSESMNEDENSEKRSLDRKDFADKEGIEEKETEAADAEKWNKEPIIGESTNNGITVSVNAPAGSFPEGTTMKIAALTNADAEAKTSLITEDTEAVAFDISFFDADGNKVQPGNGKTVSVSFYAPAGSVMSAEENENAILSVYHIADDGESERMKSVSAPDQSVAASAEVEASSFSVYVLLKEGEETVPALRAGGTPQAVDVQISDFKLETLLYTTPDRIFYNDTFYLSMDWDASSLGTNVHEGDYFDITLPDNMRFPEGTTARDFDLEDDNGNVIAHAHVTPGPGDAGGNVRVTFTDAVEDKYDLKGHIYLAARFNRELITMGEYNTFSITVNSDLGGDSQTVETGVFITGPKELENEYIGKWGQAVYNQPNVAEWWVRINHTKADLTNTVLSDTLGSSGESYIPESFILREVEFDPYGNRLSEKVVDTSGILTFSEDRSSFVLDLGDLNGTQYQLVYRTTYTPGSVLRNAANLHSEEIDRTFRATHVSAESGGTGSGSLAGRIRIIKVDEDDVTTMLANAMFEVTAPNGQTFTLTTGADGTVTSDILQQGTYRVREIQAPEGYEINPDESEFTMEVSASGGAVHRVKNKKVSLIDIPVSKNWDDANDQDGIRPSNVTVSLFADGVDTGRTVVLSEANNWSDRFTELEEKDPVDGHVIIYSVKEDGPVPGYTSSASGDAATGYTITNTHEPEVTEITGSKTWDDNDDQDGVRPENITIRLLQNGTEIDSKTVGEAENWSWTFTDLPKYENGGTEIVYSVTEDAVSDYTPEVSGYNVTNHHTPGKTSVPVSKVWDDADDQDGLRPLTITVKLLANDVDTGKTLELNAGNNWTGTFTDLDEYQSGQKITYKVEEVDITGYSSIVSGDSETGFTITNTHVPEVTEITGTKTWEDNDNQDGVRPENITIRLLQNGSEIDSKTVGEAENWSWTFTDLPKYENGGTEIVYSITEDAVSDYTPDYDGYNVTNCHTPGKTSVPVSKVWNDSDNQDGIRPLTITVKLLADDVDTGKTLELNADNNWTGTFTDLDEYQNGQKIVYKVEEVEITGYSSVVNGNAGTGYTITNTHDPEMTEITGAKTWDDNDNQDGVRPESITIRLLKNGIEIDNKTVGEAEKWSWTFTDLPKYENGGTEILYSITEDAVSDYTPEYIGYNVTNHHTPGKTSVSVAKVWDDNNNKAGSRPDKITIRLLADGKDTGKSLVLNADNKWTGSFTELDEYKNGKKVEYSISEDSVSGYKTVIKGDAKTGFTVTNTKDPVSPTYKKSPKTGDGSNMALYFWMMLISGAAMAFLLAAMKRKRRIR